ncbi:MAG: Arc family DNA-binding protein [Pseudomonadota bacterium]|nr:Arc family DNA-binding protein [Pseudomonadota bacterium]
MAVNLSIKGVPDDVAERLRARAGRNHRSLQGELMAIVSEAATQASPMAPPRDADGRVANSGPDSSSDGGHRTALATAERKRLASTLARNVDTGTRHGWRTSEDIAAELKRRFPKATQGVPLALDIVRADRDARSR